MRRFFIPGIVFFVVFAVRVSYWAALEATPLSEWYLWQETDEWGYVDWSAHLAGGNWLDRPAWRSYFSWQVPFGTPADWERWYQKNAYFAGPLYPYALALLRLMFGSPILPARLLQLLLGCLSSALLAQAVENVGSRAAGFLRRKEGHEATSEKAGGGGAVAVGAVVSGLMYGLYGPLVFHDSFLYRDGSAAHLSTLLFVTPFLGERWRNEETASKGIQRKAFLLGFLGSLAMLLRQTVAPLSVGSVLLLSRQTPRGSLSRRRVLGAGALGLALPLAVLAARNIAVGVPPLTVDTRQATSLAWGNARGADATTSPPPTMKAILDEARGSTLKTAELVLTGYRDAPLELPKLFAKKTATFFNRFEVPDNANFYFFRDRLAILRFLPVFSCILGAGVVGLCAALARGALRKGEFALASVSILTSLLACLLVQMTSRYRVAAAGPLALGTGLFLLFTFDEVRRRQWRSAGWLVLAAMFVGLVPLLPSAIPDGRHRWVDTIVYATLVEARVSPGAAKAEIQRYLREGADDPLRELGLRACQAWLDGDRAGSHVAVQRFPASTLPATGADTKGAR